MKRKLRPLVFFDVEIEHQPVGRITFELFSNICPRTCENFRCLCTGEKGIGITTGAPLHYKGISFHRMIDEFMLQGGDISEGNGSGGESIYGGYFKDESFDIKHDKPFLLSMANKGPNTNGSQFFITMQPLPHLDGKNVAFGCVVSGEKIIKEMVKVVTDPKGKPLKSCTIVDCGDLNKLKNIKSAKRKRSVGSANVTQKEFSSENQKFKKKKKRKHKKAKKKHKKKSKEVRSDFEERSTFRSSISDEEITDEYETKREGKIASQSKRKSEAGSPVSDKRAKRWTSRSGRKIKGRGALRYHTPSQSRSRSPLDREDCGSNMQPDKGIETPPHWREAQRGQRRLSEPKSRSPMEKIWSRKWEKKSPTNNERSNATSWCSDDDASSKDEQSLSDSGWSDSQIKSRKHKLYKKATKKKKVNDQNCRSPIDGETFGPLPPPKAWRTSGKAPTAQKNVMKKTKRSSSIDPGPIESRGTCSLKIDYHTSYFMKDEDVNAAGILPHNVVKSRWDSSEEDTACDTVVQNTSVGAKAKDVERVVSGVVGMGMLSKATKHRRHKQKVEKGKVKQRKRNKDAASSPHGGKLNCRTNRRRKKSRTISSSSSSSPDPHYNRRSKIPGSPSGSTFHNNHHLRPSSSASCSRSSLSNRSTSQLSSDPSSWRSSSDHDESSLQKDKLGIHNDNKQTKTKKSQKKEQSKRKGSGLSWQPPLEFGEEDMIDDVLLTKKDKIKRGQQEDPQREYITSTVNQPNITASSFDSASEIGGAGSQMAVDFDADVIDQMLSSALGSSVPVKQKTKNELKKRLMMLKKMGCVGESVESTAGTTARKCKVENAENMECPLNNNTSGDAGGNSDKCTNKLVSNDIFGFGFMPKYQPDKPAYPKEGNKEKKEEEDVVSKTMDVGGIWSDDDLKPKQFETRNVKSQREEACDLAASKSCPGSKVLQSETIKSRHNAGIKETNKVKNDSDSNSDGQLTVGGNLQTTKKPFIFNIKLPKTEARTSEIPSKRKQKKKSKKRKKETRAKADPAPPTPSQVNAPRSVPQTSPVATTTCVDTNAVVTNSKVTAKYTAASNPPPGGRTSVPVFSQAHYYSLPVALPYMHSYHLHYPTSQLHAYMQYHMGRTPVHNYHPFPQEQPPLPEYDEPARPPEPTTDPQRLSDTAVAAMFISSDITDEKLQTLFGDREEEHELPSPASSMTSSHSERRRSRKKKRRRRRSTSSPRSSSRSGRSLSYVRSSSSGRSSYDRGRRRRSRSSYGSSRSTSSRRSYSRHRSRSASYFSATSSSSYSSRSSLSKYSSGSDIDRPCRHYRRRQRRSRTRSRDDSRGWSSGSSYSARGRTRSRDRSSISWSRSPSSAPRSSYSD